MNPRTLRSMPSICASAVSPAVLSLSPPGVRVNSDTPIASSSPFTRAVSAAGVMLSASAAATSEPACVIAISVCNCANVICLTRVWSKALCICCAAIFEQFEAGQNLIQFSCCGKRLG